MNESLPDNRPSPYRRGPTPWIVWVGVITFFVGLNLMPVYFTEETSHSDGIGDPGFPQPFQWETSRGSHFDFPMFFLDLGIAIAGTLFFVRGLRDGIRGFWDFLRNAGVNYGDAAEDSES